MIEFKIFFEIFYWLSLKVFFWMNKIKSIYKGILIKKYIILVWILIDYLINVNL